MVTARPEEIWTQSTARSDAPADPGSGVRNSYFWFRLTRFLLEFRPASVIHSNNCCGGPQEFMIQYQPAYGSQVSSDRIPWRCILLYELLVSSCLVGGYVPRST